MSSGIFTRKAGKLIFHNKIQQSSIDFTRFYIGKRSNRSAKEIIIIGIGEVTQFVSILSHRDKQANKLAHEQTRANMQKRQIEREDRERERANKTARVKWGRGKREANGK